MGLKRKIKGEKGSAVIIMVATLAILGVVGYVLGSLMARHQESIPTNMDSARAFTIAQSGVEYASRYLIPFVDYTAVSNPPSKSLGNGNFNVAFSGANALGIDAVITGNSGTAARRVAVRFRKKGGAIVSRGPITIGGNPNGSVACTSTLNCDNASIHNCACTQENVPAGDFPAIVLDTSLPEPNLGCNIGAHVTNTINAGSYYCSGTFQIGGNSDVSLNGPVIIYCQGLDIANLTNLNISGSASNLILVVSNTVVIGQNTAIKGAIYAPSASISMANSSVVTGLMVGNSISMSNIFTVNYDPSAGANTTLAPYVETKTKVIDWREM
jgi:hypothetical protein